MRAIEYGYRIRVLETSLEKIGGVDLPEHVKAAAANKNYEFLL